MCMITPYTLPCCRRTYVAVAKVSTCQDNWPRTICPPEMCIQLGGEKPHARKSGECWRCEAKRRGLSGFQRDRMRPITDKAIIGPGLDAGVSMDSSVRQRRGEANAKRSGICWYCGCEKGCTLCNKNKKKDVSKGTAGPALAVIAKKGRSAEEDTDLSTAICSKRLKLTEPMAPPAATQPSPRTLQPPQLDSLWKPINSTSEPQSATTSQYFPGGTSFLGDMTTGGALMPWELSGQFPGMPGTNQAMFAYHRYSGASVEASAGHSQQVKQDPAASQNQTSDDEFAELNSILDEFNSSTEYPESYTYKR